MAKIIVVESDDQTRVPFLRGILTRSLQDSGLSFDDAYDLATQVRQQLGDTPEIGTRSLRKLVAELLQATHGARLVERYLHPAHPPSTIHVRHQDGRITPFSILEHQRCLESIGLAYEETTRVIAKINRELLAKRAPLITSQSIARKTFQVLSDSPELGPPVARRYLVWVDFVRSGRPLILMIGGTAGCGKSTVATALASRLDIVRTQSTDMLREVMRTMFPARLLPILHTSSFNAWQALPGNAGVGETDPDTLLADGYQTQAELISVASEAVIQRALRERVSLILEGVHIHPAVMERMPEDTDALIVPVMLAILKRKQLLKRIKGRGTQVPQRRAERYLHYFDDIWRLQSFLLSEADRAQIPIIVNDEREKVIREVMRIIIGTLATDFTSTVDEVFGPEDQ
jgi:2-phosphoglycerate kinase